MNFPPHAQLPDAVSSGEQPSFLIGAIADGYGTRSKVVLKRTNRGKVYFLAKSYDKDIGELRSEVCASAIGRVFGFPVQQSWLCRIPQYKKLGLKHPVGVLIQLEVRRQKDPRRKQFREDLLHGAALIAQVDRNFSRLKNEIEGRKLYTLSVVIQALRNYVAKHPEAKDVWKEFFKLLVFDALIGGTDRHYFNWGILEVADTGRFLRLAPAFDNGISLLWNTEHHRKAFLRESLTGNFARKAPSMFKKDVGGKYSLYEVLDALYSIDEYRGTQLSKKLLDGISNVGSTGIRMALSQNIPNSKRFQTKEDDLGVLCAYVKMRFDLLRGALDQLVGKYDEGTS